MSHHEGIKKHIRELFIGQKLAVLSTHCSGQPYASLVAFWGKEDLKEIFFVTPRTTRKHANFSADSRVALLINSSMNVDADFHEAVCVTALGCAEEIGGAEKVQVLKRYLAKHPYLEDFANAPTCALIGVKIISYVLVKNFQHVMELSIEQ
jgi:hypothetical protein